MMMGEGPGHEPSYHFAPNRPLTRRELYFFFGASFALKNATVRS